MENKMKKIIIVLLFLTTTAFPQKFKVESIVGEAKVLHGSSENWEQITVGEILEASDLIITEKGSQIKLKNRNQIFSITEELAIGLSNVKPITIDELILALALEEIRNVPKKNKNGISQNTAVYGSEVKNISNLTFKNNELGYLKIKGAKYLTKTGFKESGIIAAMEVFRNYPVIAKNYEHRIYFADQLYELNLLQEAIDEISKIKKLDLNEAQKIAVENRIKDIEKRLVQN